MRCVVVCTFLGRNSCVYCLVMLFCIGKVKKKNLLLLLSLLPNIQKKTRK